MPKLRVGLKVRLIVLNEYFGDPVLHGKIYSIQAIRYSTNNYANIILNDSGIYVGQGYRFQLELVGPVNKPDKDKTTKELP